MPAGAAVAADVPGKYDVVVNGFGYCFLDSLEESIPFRTHRAVFGQTPPFVERQNVSNSYGDNAQDFFLTIRQRDWSLGEQQKFFRAGQDGRYWHGSNIDISVPGQVSLAPTVSTATFAAAVCACNWNTNQQTKLITASATNLYTIDSAGTITDNGAHGLGATPSKFGLACDGVSNYVSTLNPGTVGVRKWNGAAYSTFSASAGDSLAFLNNTLYGYRSATGDFGSWDSGGTFTTLYTWKRADGSAYAPPPAGAAIVEPFGGRILIMFPYGATGCELWIYDGSGVSLLAVFPPNFVGSDLEILYGVAFIGGSFQRAASTTTFYNRPAVLFYNQGQIGSLWKADDYSTTASTSLPLGPHPALVSYGGRLVFSDDTTNTLLAYNPETGGVSTVGSYTGGGTDARMAATGLTFFHSRNVVGAYYSGNKAYPTSGYVISSLIDFDSSLTKQFRGVKVEWDAATDGNGGSVDVAYQVDSLTGSWTTLQTGAVSGTEYDFTNISGHAIAIRVTLNKGTSTAGPVVKSCSVRGVPEMPIYPRGEYILDCSSTAALTQKLNDGSLHPLTGYEQVQNLTTARNSTAPISVTDAVNGTFSAFVDVNDPQGFDVYEIRAAVQDVTHPGSYVVRLTVRGV